MISKKKPAAFNRTCQACKISKIKCDVETVDDEERCSRCARLDLQCIRMQRRNDGSARLSAPGVCALRVSGKVDSSMMETRLVKYFFTNALSACSSNHILRALLRWCAQLAWSHNDSELMSWVLGQAPRCGLPLSDFAPVSSPLEAPGTPPSFISEVLGRSGLGVAFASLGGRMLWVVNDEFDQLVCRRRTMTESPGVTSCAVCSHFSPEDELQTFETEVIAPLVAALAPAHSSEEAPEAEEAPAAEGAVSVADLDSGSAIITSHQTSDLHSEIVDSTSMWRIYLRSVDAYVCCAIVFRCALQRDGTIWIVGSYQPCQAPDGSWITERPTASCAPPQLANADQQMPERKEVEKSRRAKAARTVGAVEASQGAVESPMAEASQAAISMIAAASTSSAEDDGRLEEQLEFMSASELLSLF